MPVVDYRYDKSVLSHIKEWPFGINWPSVYIIYNDNQAYVGETLDAYRRTEQHLQEKEFDSFENIVFISDKSYNKSVILDLESFLIKYIGADQSKKLLNGNSGVLNHNYFYKELYEDDFKYIWQELINLKIVKHSISEIESSELFKYSPYKALNTEQAKALYDILKSLSDINNASYQNRIIIKGGAGTGKTILAVFLMKLLVDINNNKTKWNYIEDDTQNASIKLLMNNLNNLKKVGLVIPQSKLRKDMRHIFDSIDNLSHEMVLAPKDVINTSQYDVLIVDEAHRLYKRQNLSGIQSYSEFDKVNERIMGDSFTKSVNDYTELDWIIKSSKYQILFYDDLQRIRTADIDKDRFDQICGPSCKHIELTSQMRCKGGNGYYEYIKDILNTPHFSIKNYKHINNYQLKVVDHIDSLFDLIIERNKEVGLCKVVAGPGWSMNENIEIEGKSFKWAGKNDNIQNPNTIWSIHKIQGFDLNYAGVIFGKEIRYDTFTEKLEINKRELKDNQTKSSGDEQMRQFILNTYLTLMTRGIEGTFVYAFDNDLRDYLHMFLD